MISGVVLTKNEEKNIIDCIESLLWCGEIVVIDDNSSDRTVEILRSLNNPKIRVVKHELNQDFSKQRNFALTKVKGDWVLFVDADERVSKTLEKEIQSEVLKNDKHGFYLRRHDVMWGKELKHAEQGSIKLLRFAKKGSGEWTGTVHEVWNVSEPLGTLDSHLLHFPHPSVRDFLSDINRYSTMRAETLLEKKTSVSGFAILCYPIGKFFLNYFLRLGFLDGIAGLVYAMMMSFHSFLVRAKLWLFIRKKYDAAQAFFVEAK